MRLSIATNFDDSLIDAVRAYPVAELYGKLDKDFVGGGRSSYILSPINKKTVERHVRLANKYGIDFNYLLNASCTDNLEITREGQREIRHLLDWITSIGVSAVTVSTPFLLRTIKKSYPTLKVRASVFACVDNLKKARFWQDSGADVICLDSHSVNREFATLRFLRKHLKCGLELFVNNNCMASCFMAHTHPNVMSHSSQSRHKTGGFVIDHCMLFCLKEKIKNPVQMIRSDWIRPEDLKYYEEIGIDHFKLSERNIPTHEMVRRVRAYSERRYDGNLLDLIQGFGFAKSNQKSNGNAIAKLKFLIKPGKINVLKLKPFKELCELRGMLVPRDGKAPVYVDNQKLDGFIERFLKKSCREEDCQECRYCHRFAEKAVTISPTYRNQCLNYHNKIDEELYSGSLWR